MIENPGLWGADAEMTGLKEMVSRQMTDKWRWTVKNPKFAEYLDFAVVTRRLMILHNDGGNHGKSVAGRPAPAWLDYENLDMLKDVFGQPKYRGVQIIFAHTFISRLGRPDPTMTTRTHTIYDFDWTTGESKGQRTKVITAPEHIHQLYDVFEKVPNARADLSWNDVTQAYIELMHSGPKAADALVEFVIDQQDRLLFGSDTVKPVNEGQYNQALVTGSPLFMEIARRDEDAAFKILRGNYDDALRIAYEGTDAWTKTALKKKYGNDPATAQKLVSEMQVMRSRLDGKREKLGREARERFHAWAAQVQARSKLWDDGAPDEFQKSLQSLPPEQQKDFIKWEKGLHPRAMTEWSGDVQSAIAQMKKSASGIPEFWNKDAVNSARNLLPEGKQAEFDQWMNEAARTTTAWSTDVQRAIVAREYGVFQQLYEQLPRAIHLDQKDTGKIGRGIGRGTSGGERNDSHALRNQARLLATLTLLGLGAAGAGLDLGSLGITGHAGHAMAESYGGGYAAATPGSHFADLLNEAAFAGRAVANVARTAYLEKLRLQWEQIFEEGFGTLDALYRYVSKLLNSAPWVGITALQRAHIAAATDQFWLDFTFLRSKPLDPANGWTDMQRFLAIHAKIGEYMITVSREGNLQESSVNAAEARRWQGQLLRGFMLTSYLANDTIAGKRLFSAAPWHDIVASAGAAGHAQAAVALAQAALFFVGNTSLAANMAGSLGGGLRGISSMETSKAQKTLQEVIGMPALGAGASFLATNQGMTTVAGYLNHVGAGADATNTILTLLTAAFAGKIGQTAWEGIRRQLRKPAPKPAEMEERAIWANAALGLFEGGSMGESALSDVAGEVAQEGGKVWQEIIKIISHGS
jgi:hypothetical protein